jgi:branched-chain amino acid aminotransferase
MGRDRIESSQIDWIDEYMRIWVNDRLVDELVLPATGSPWLMGDGVFESLRTYDSQPFALQRHIERLLSSAHAMNVKIPEESSITRGINEVLDSNPASPFGRLRITLLSDGTLVITHTLFEPSTQALSLAQSESIQHSNRGTSGMKTMSYAENSTALRKAQARGYDDVVFCNETGEVVETALANLIWFDGQNWWTPALSSGCLPGVTRSLLIENFGIKENQIYPEEIKSAKSLAITSSVREIVNVERYESKLFELSKELTELQGSFHAWILGNLGI